MNKLLNIALVSSTLLISACNDDDDPVKVTETAEVTSVVDIAVSDENFSTLVSLLEATNLDDTLDDPTGQFTVFAPTNAAFELLGEETLTALQNDPDALTNILTYHVIGSKVDATTAISLAGQTAEMVNGDIVGLSLAGESLLVNTSTVTATDIMADNGIIHVLDAVLLPPTVKGEPTANIVETAVANGGFKTLVSVLQETGLDSVLADESKSYTVFAPTDAAFALLGDDTISTLLKNPDVLKDILLQHVVEGEVDSVTAFSLNGKKAKTVSGVELPISINTQTDMLQFAGANIVTKDIYTTNGVIHVIDAVIVDKVQVPVALGTLVDVATSAGSFETLLAALEVAGLADTLADEDKTFTVFAPTDAAFALLPKADLDALLADKEALANVLLYHVIADAKVASDGAIAIANSEENKATMANEGMIALSVTNGNLYINSSMVSTANVMADNGVIHVVDQVILPPKSNTPSEQTITELAIATDDLSTLVTALTTAELADALNDKTKNYTVFAPTNKAFSKIPADTLTALLADKDKLSKVLLQHVVASPIDSVSAFAANGKSVNTLAEDDVTVQLVNNTKATNSESDEVAYSSSMQMLVGGTGSSKSGFTLYVFDNDLEQASSTCVDGCAEQWPPVLVTDESAENITGLSTIMRQDGSKQAAYLGRPLYFFAGDEAAGDMKGDGVNNVWWKVSLPQVTLQIQGSNVTTTDIYTANGVVHLIDTVITETLE